VNTNLGTGAETNPQHAAGMIRFRSQALDEISKQLTVKPGSNILDLGMPLGTNIEYFSHYSCRLFIENLYSHFNDTSTPSLPAQFSSLANYTQQGDLKLDLILCWDLFDYLKSVQIMAVVDLFRPYVQRGTMLYVLTSDTRMISEQPQCYRLKENNYIEPELPTLKQRDNPRHRPAVLQEYLGSFKLHRSFMLANGRMEHLFQAV
jgi:hypothetical protein